jgi:hypothetical protein
VTFPKQYVELLWKALQALGTGAALGVIAFILLEALPVYLKNYEFEQAMRKEVRLVVANPKPAPTIQGELYQKAQDIGVPVDIDQIRVDSGVVIPSTGILDTVMAPQSQNPTLPLGSVEIEVSYAVPIRFPGYTLELRFHLHADDQSA